MIFSNYYILKYKLNHLLSIAKLGTEQGGEFIILK